MRELKEERAVGLGFQQLVNGGSQYREGTVPGVGHEPLQSTFDHWIKVLAWDVASIAAGG